MEPLLLPSGYGFRPLRPGEFATRGLAFDQAVLDTCTFWEPPRRRGPRRYVIGADVGDGLGQDRSVIEVLRVGTIDEPAEQVAEYISAEILPAGLSYIIQTLGQYYVDEDGLEALVAIECNGHGLTTQDTLQLHLGYGHFYNWEFHDAYDPSRRYSTKVGWYTSPRSRPMLLSKIHAALIQTDAITGLPDLVTRSPYLHNELKDFQTETMLWEAAAARGAHDDAIMATAIAYYVTWKLQGGELEPLEDRRRRKSEQTALLALAAEQAAQPLLRPDWRNTPATAEEADDLAYATGEDLDAALYDVTRRDY